MKLKNKKGDVTDSLVLLITITIFAIGFFILAFVIPQITDGLKVADMNSTSEGASAIDQLENLGVVGIQRGFFLLFVGLIISTLISSFLTRTHPIFLFLYIIFLALTVFLGTYLGNVYETVSNTAPLSNILSSQGLITVVMENIITIMIAVGALSMIIVFAKFSSIRGGGIQDI